MTPVSELLAETAQPPFDIMRAASVEFLVTDLDASQRFYVDLLGLVLTERTDDALYLRGWEERLHHSIVLRKADRPAVARVSFRVRSNDDLEPLAAEFERRGCPVRFADGDVAGMGRSLRVWDPLGFPLEFFHDMEQFETQLQRFDIQRGAPIMRLDHFNLHTPRGDDAVRFWLELGFRCTEYISTDGDERITGCWFRRKSTVHDVALTVGRGPRLHHIGVWVTEPAGVLRCCDQLVGGAPHRRDRARAGTPRRLERLLRLPARP